MDVCVQPNGGERIVFPLCVGDSQSHLDYDLWM